MQYVCNIRRAFEDGQDIHTHINRRPKFDSASQLDLPSVIFIPAFIQGNFPKGNVTKKNTRIYSRTFSYIQTRTHA